MYFLDRSLRHPLALLLLACTACVPGSLKLGEDTDDAASGSASDTGEPTTGEPAPEGVLEWTRTFNDISGFDMAVAGDGSIVVGGMSGYTFNGGDGGMYANLWVGKFDAAGTPLWQVETPIGAEESRSTIAVAVGPDGVVHVLDVDYSVQAGGGNAIRRFAADGEALGSTSLPLRPTVIAAIAGGTIVGGAEITDDAASSWLARLDNEGGVVWEQNLGAPSLLGSNVHAVAVDGDDVIVAGARGVDQGDSKSQAWLARIAVADGATVWERTIEDEVETDIVYDLGLAGDGTILARVRGDQDFVRAFSPAGDELWNQLLTEVRGANIAVASDGSFAMTAGLYLPADDPNSCVAGDGTCPIAMQVVRHDADRSLRWSSTHDECPSGNIAAITPDDRVLVLAGCSKDGLSDAVMGLMMFAP
ncbi:MAG: hypothetical protein H0T76_24245 [Nannocystis sp.]|nr:PQQ-binding-like beta-propeller repeat protein [Nannocystis sp.]MBA3549600.1 hypothetical protein [Nannocystis sp.]